MVPKLALKKPSEPDPQLQPLTDKQELFVHHYISNGQNITQAAISAGYAEKSAGQQGSKVLQKPHVRARVDIELERVMKALLAKYEVSEERVLKERAKIAFFNAAELFDPKNNTLLPPNLWPEDVGAVIQGITENTAGDITVKLASKEMSLSALEKYLGMYQKDNDQKVTPLSQIVKELQGTGLKL